MNPLWYSDSRKFCPPGLGHGAPARRSTVAVAGRDGSLGRTRRRTESRANRVAGPAVAPDAGPSLPFQDVNLFASVLQTRPGRHEVGIVQRG